MEGFFSACFRIVQLNDIRFFDILFKRYSSPMILLDQMIRTRRLFEFVNELVHMHNEEKEDQEIWEVWLHRIFDKNLAEFKASLTEYNTAAPTQEEQESIVQDSYDILAGFVPDEGLVNSCDGVSAAGNDSDQQRPGEPGA